MTDAEAECKKSREEPAKKKNWYAKGDGERRAWGYLSP